MKNKKEIKKKLTLNKQSVANLDILVNNELGRAAGGTAPTITVATIPPALKLTSVINETLCPDTCSPSDQLELCVTEQ